MAIRLSHFLQLLPDWAVLISYAGSYPIIKPIGPGLVSDVAHLSLSSSYGCPYLWPLIYQRALSLQPFVCIILRLCFCLASVAHSQQNGCGKDSLWHHFWFSLHFLQFWVKCLSCK